MEEHLRPKPHEIQHANPDWETTPATSECRVPSHPYRRLRGQAKAAADREYWDQEECGVIKANAIGLRADYERRRDRDCMFDRLTGRAHWAGHGGPLADLQARGEEIIAAHTRATS